MLLRQLAGLGARHTLQHLRGYEAEMRLGVVLDFLLNSMPQLTHELMDMYTRLVGR